MGKEEKILLGLAVLGLAAIVVYQRPIAAAISGVTPVAEGESLTPQNSSMTSGPQYLQYNSPWAFAPPVGNFLPDLTVGQVGQSVEAPSAWRKAFKECGC